MENIKPGKWHVIGSAPELPKKLADGFAQVTANISGARYTPLLYTASQVPEGVNYVLICEVTPAETDIHAAPTLAAAYIHEPIPAQDGGFRLWVVKPIKIGF
jgi:hypothetical protein